MSDDLLHYDTLEEYRTHYENNYCRTPILTFDNIRIFFKKDCFKHAFFESTKKDGTKDIFSKERAMRMNWIKKGLLSKETLLYQGWDKKNRTYSFGRRVTVVIDDFVVVISLGLNRRGELKGEFITCYVATNSIEKIKTSPKWNKEECIKLLNKSSR